MLSFEALFGGLTGGGMALSLIIFFAKKYLTAFEKASSQLQSVQIELAKIVVRLDIREKESEVIREIQTEIAVIKSIIYGKQNKSSGSH